MGMAFAWQSGRTGSSRSPFAQSRGDAQRLGATPGCAGFATAPYGGFRLGGASGSVVQSGGGSRREPRTGPGRSLAQCATPHGSASRRHRAARRGQGTGGPETSIEAGTSLDLTARLIAYHDRRQRCARCCLHRIERGMTWTSGSVAAVPDAVGGPPLVSPLARRHDPAARLAMLAKAAWTCPARHHGRSSDDRTGGRGALANAT